MKLKELQVVRTRRPINVYAEVAPGVSVLTELPAGLVGTIVDLSATHAYVERVNDDGKGFLFVVDLAELEPAGD